MPKIVGYVSSNNTDTAKKDVIRMITQGNLQPLTKIDNCFEKLDIDWLKKQNRDFRSEKLVLRDYVYKIESDTEDIIILGDEGQNYWAMSFPKDSYFSTYRSFDSNGSLRAKGWAFDGEPKITGFKKGTWHYFDQSGKLTETIDHDATFKFTFEDVVRFCESHNIVLSKGYSKFRRRTLIQKELKYFDCKNPVWKITHYPNDKEYVIIVIDSVTGELGTMPCSLRYTAKK
jgi:hypothetical protein